MEHPNKMIDSFEGTIEIFNENTRILRKEVRPRERTDRKGGREKEGRPRRQAGMLAGSGRKASLC